MGVKSFISMDSDPGSPVEAGAIDSERKRMSASQSTVAHQFLLRILFTIITVVLIATALTQKPVINGDWYEYIYMTHSLRVSKTPEFGADTVESLRILAVQHLGENHNQILNQIAEDIKDNKETSYGFFRNDQGEYYSYH